MNVSALVTRQVRRALRRAGVKGDANVVVAANVREPGATTAASAATEGGKDDGTRRG